MLLDVQLLGFQRENNLETRKTDNGRIRYCCCEGGPCGSVTTASQLQNCPPTCDVFFDQRGSLLLTNKKCEGFPAQTGFS